MVAVVVKKKVRTDKFARNMGGEKKKVNNFDLYNFPFMVKYE